MDSSRRSFLGGIAAASTLSLPAAMAAAAQSAGMTESLKLGVASYSLRAFQRRTAIAILKRLGVSYVNIKDFHLPMNLTPDELKKGADEFRRAGLTILGGGTVSFQSTDDADIKAKFEYAKNSGMPLIVSAPNHTTLPMLEKYAKEYDIKVAVHNHGTEDKWFPNPQSVLKMMSGMDPRMGCCFDIGHAIRTGVDIVETARECGPRLLDMHVKDLADTTKSSSQVPVGDGKIPIVALMKQLKKMNYQGGIMLEYEIEEENPVAGMNKSLAYLRGIRDSLA